MTHASQTQENQAGDPVNSRLMEKRIQELEIKTSFLEKELEEYKEASRNFYGRLNRMEEELRKLEKEIPGTNLPTPEATWDSENHQVRT